MKNKKKLQELRFYINKLHDELVKTTKEEDEELKEDLGQLQYIIDQIFGR